VPKRKSLAAGVKAWFERSLILSKKTYTTKLSAVECLQRLQAYTYDGRDCLRLAFSPPEKGTVFAKVRGSRFRLFAQGRKYVQNSFVPLFYGRVEESDGTTRIIGGFRMHLFARVFLFVWFGGLAIMAVIFPIVAFSGDFNVGEPPLIFVIGPLPMMLFGVGLVSFGQWIARGQVAKLREFLRVEFEATQDSGDATNQMFRSSTTGAPH